MPRVDEKGAVVKKRGREEGHLLSVPLSTISLPLSTKPPALPTAAAVPGKQSHMGLPAASINLAEAAEVAERARVAEVAAAAAEAEAAAVAAEAAAEAAADVERLEEVRREEEESAKTREAAEFLLSLSPNSATGLSSCVSLLNTPDLRQLESQHGISPLLAPSPRWLPPARAGGGAPLPSPLSRAGARLPPPPPSSFWGMGSRMS